MRTTCAKVSPAAVEQRADVLEDAARLRGDVAVDQLAGGRVERNLARDEEQLAGLEGRRVGPDGFRRAGGLRRSCFSFADARRP